MKALFCTKICDGAANLECRAESDIRIMCLRKKRSGKEDYHGIDRKKEFKYAEPDKKGAQCSGECGY